MEYIIASIVGLVICVASGIGWIAIALSLLERIDY